VLVVAHDADLARVAGRNVVIAESTLAELSVAGERAPLALEEVMEQFPKRLNIEIKEDRPDVADALAAMIERRGRQQSVMVASFHCDVLERFREVTGHRVATSACGVEAVRFYLCYLLGIPARPHYVALQIPARARVDLTRQEFIQFIHRHGLKVHYWTVDDEGEMARMLRAGADGIMTNRPDLLARVIASRAVQ
jgi:glycerophosphoryl diester phosphodiesterase